MLASSIRDRRFTRILAKMLPKQGVREMGRRSCGRAGLAHVGMKHSLPLVQAGGTGVVPSRILLKKPTSLPFESSAKNALMAVSHAASIPEEVLGRERASASETSSAVIGDGCITCRINSRGGVGAGTGKCIRNFLGSDRVSGDGVLGFKGRNLSGRNFAFIGRL